MNERKTYSIPPFLTLPAFLRIQKKGAEQKIDLEKILEQLSENRKFINRTIEALNDPETIIIHRNNSGNDTTGTSVITETNTIDEPPTHTRTSRKAYK